MADKRIFQLEEEGFLDDITDKVYMWLDKKANEGELQEPSWKFKANVFLKILNNFATKFVPNVATVKGKCYWHNGELYVCDTAYTGDWVPGNFTLTSVDELFARKDVLSALQTNVGNLQGALETTNGNVTALSTYAQNVAHSVVSKSSVYGPSLRIGLVAGYINVSGGIGSVVDYTRVTDSGSYSYYASCSKGDVFKIKGVGGNNGRLWCFVDSSDKIVDVAAASATTDGEYIYKEAPVDGKVIIQFTSNAATNDFFKRESVNYEFDAVKDFENSVYEKSSIYGDSLLSSSNYHKSITTNGGVGSTVDYTEVALSGCVYSVQTCKKGDVFKLRGLGYSSARLWCFVDASDTVVDYAYSNALNDTGTDFVYLTAPVDGKIIVNLQIVTNRYFAKRESVQGRFDSDEASNSAKFLSINEKVSLETENVFLKSSYYGASMASSRTTGKGYVTNTGIGSTVDMTGASLAGIVSFVIPCVKGDVFKIMGVGYSTYRMWCFVDANNKIVEVADASITTNGAFIYKEAPVDGKAIIQFNAQSSSYVWDLYVRSSVDDGFKAVNDFENSVYEKSSVFNSLLDKFTWNKSITTSGGVGSTIDYTESSLSGCMYIVQTCNKGDVFKIRGIGYTNARLWCFVDSSDKVVDYAYSNALNDTGTDFVYLTAPVDGKIIVNLQIISGRFFAVRASVEDRMSADEERIEFIEQSAPIVNLELDKEPFDPTSLLSGFDFSDNSNYTSNLYALFDALLAASDGKITKFDVGEFCEETYPAYCGDEKIYCYKISKTYDGWGNSEKFKKRKLLITGGVHGNEKAAPFNLYIMAWRLINDSAHSDVFSLFDAFDIYIIPCVNLYGLKNDTRWNGNGVDINRNSDTVGWEVSGEPYQSTYTGPYADSEFETRCVHKCIEDLEADWYIDHHNYALLQQQFYTEVNDKRIFLRSYEALKEVSLFCVKNFPTYFGTKFHLLKDMQYPSATPEGLNMTIGCLEKWAFENGFLSTTIEISQNINYYGGVVDVSTFRDNFGATTFSVGEFTLRCQLILYGQILMPQVYS